MFRSIRPVLCCVGIATLIAQAKGWIDVRERHLIDEFLRAAVRSSAGEPQSVDCGETVARSVEPSDSHGVAAVGLARLNVFPDFFVDSFSEWRSS